MPYQRSILLSETGDFHRCAPKHAVCAVLLELDVMACIGVVLDSNSSDPRHPALLDAVVS
jgi:hypothetical protein